MTIQFTHKAVHKKKGGTYLVLTMNAVNKENDYDENTYIVYIKQGEVPIRWYKRSKVNFCNSFIYIAL